MDLISKAARPTWDSAEKDLTPSWRSSDEVRSAKSSQTKRSEQRASAPWRPRGAL